MKILGKHGAIISGEESPDAVVGDRAKHIRIMSPIEFAYYVYHDPIIRFPESHPNTDPNQQLPTPWQGEQDNPDNQCTEDTH